MHFKLKIKHNH